MKSFLPSLMASIALLLAACGATPGVATERPTAAPALVQVDVVPAQREDMTQRLELVGNLVARRRTTIVTEVDGVLRSIAAGGEDFALDVDGERREEALAIGMGQKVEAGDVLVRIDPRDYELALAAAEAGLATARSDLAVLNAWHRPEEVRRLRALREQAAARVELSALELKRIEELRATKVVSQSEHDRVRSGHAVAVAVLDGADAAVAVATSGPTASEVARAEARVGEAQARVDVQRDRLDRTTIRAPFDGVVTERFVDVGERVTAMPRVEILELMDLRLVFVEVGVPERHAHQVSRGDEAHVRVPGTAELLVGEVMLVNDKVDRATRTYRVRVALDNRAGRLKAGLFVRVEFALRSASDRLVVPVRAITYGGGQPLLFVLQGERVEARDVRLGLSDGKRVEILDGLVLGESVVVDDPAVLASGMRVEVRPAASASEESSR